VIQTVTRIFAALALCSVGLLLANVLVGLWGGDYNGLSQRLGEGQRRLELLKKASPQDVADIQQVEQTLATLRDQLPPIKRHARWHMLLGVLAALVTVLVNSISVTYFIGTSRWCKEVTEAYELDGSLAQRSRSLKRKSLPWSMAGLAIVVMIVAMGAAADPGTLRPDTAKWVMPHAVGAIVGTIAIGWCLKAQTSSIGANLEIINAVVAEVERIRRDRGLAE
jgi:hypothetical protein